MGRFFVVSMVSKYAHIMGILGQFWVAWPYSSQKAQGRIYRGSMVAFTFLPLALFRWGNMGASAVVGFYGPGGG